MKSELSVALFNREGKLLREVRQPSRSFTKQFIGFLYIFHSFMDFSMPDISNTARVVDNNYSQYSLQLAAKGGGVAEPFSGGQPGSTGYAASLLGDSIGIQVGSNATAPTPTDYAMNTRIAHGQAVGQLVYAGCEVEPPVISAPNATMLIRRYFTNKSGGNVIVREVGLYTIGLTGATTGFAFLICRDALATDITVLNNELLRVEYTMQVTV